MSDSKPSPPSWFTRSYSYVVRLVDTEIEPLTYDSDASSYAGDIPDIPKTKTKGKSKPKSKRSKGKDQCPSVKPSRSNPAKTSEDQQSRYKCRAAKGVVEAR
jgi:hypothetical protein